MATALKNGKNVLKDRVRGTIYGNCTGDAIGLLTEFMSKEEANYWFPADEELELELKSRLEGQRHQSRWETGDWTDDSDQMILILQSIIDNKGKVDDVDFAKKMYKWARYGFRELGDQGGLGIGMTTYRVLSDEKFQTKPWEVAEEVWLESNKFLAPNGGVMRTSILGIHEYKDMKKVIENTLKICKTTHADPRCAASCVAVTTAIAMMLRSDNIDVDDIVKKSYDYAKKQLTTTSEKNELKRYMNMQNLKELKLDEQNKIGYTYKCLGAGFWALRQDDFREALTAIVREAGDADTNGAVAGALLGCKLGYKALPSSWKDNLLHKGWLEEKLKKFFKLSIPELVQDETDAAKQSEDKRGKGQAGTESADTIKTKELADGETKLSEDRKETEAEKMDTESVSNVESPGSAGITSEMEMEKSKSEEISGDGKTDSPTSTKKPENDGADLDKDEEAGPAGGASTEDRTPEAAATIDDIDVEMKNDTPEDTTAKEKECPGSKGKSEEEKDVEMEVVDEKDGGTTAESTVSPDDCSDKGNDNAAEAKPSTDARA